jgi:PHD/YefM family antitoxin component YafN of YafNO toxin-antitoxin module
MMWYKKLVHMSRKLAVPLSRARARLFQLADLVSTSDGTVVLERRGGAESVVLVREARLAYLEAKLAELEARDAAPFKLAGSLVSPVGDEQILEGLRAIRREWSATPAAPAARSRTSRRGR